MTDEELIAIKERAEGWLLSIPGVFGVGVGPKMTNGELTPRLGITVFVTRKRPLGELSESERIPVEIEGVPTDVFETGMPVLIQAPPKPDETKYAALRGGIQISVSGGAGTLACIARTTNGYPRGAGKDVLLTCQHVLHSGSQIEPGSAHSIGQPIGHGCCESCDFCSNVVAHDRAPCVHSPEVDGGLAELKPGIEWWPEIMDTPSPIPITGTYVVKPSDLTSTYNVWKRGRTTLRTAGRILNVAYSGRVNNHDGTLHRSYTNSIFILTGTAGSPFADGGDSGALLMNTVNQAVGLVFMKSGNNAVACGIDWVTSQLHIEIRTTANTPAGVQKVPVPPPPPQTSARAQAPRLPQPPGEPAPPEDVLVRKNPAQVYSQLAATAAGAEFVRALMLHRSEIVQNIARRPRVIVAWRRFGGPQVAKAISLGLHEDQVVIPNEIHGRAAGSCAQALVREIKRYASPALVADIEKYSPMVEPLAGLTYRELVAALHGPKGPVE